MPLPQNSWHALDGKGSAVNGTIAGLGYWKVGLDGLKTLPLEQRICDTTIKLEDVVDGRGISWLLLRYPTAKASV